MISLLNVKQNFFMQFVALLIFIFLLPLGICSQPREIIFDGTGSLTRDIVKAKLVAENLQLNEEWSATIRGYNAIGDYAFARLGLVGNKVDTNQMVLNLVSVTIENGCEKIGTQAFIKLSSLTTVNIQSNLKVIETQAFQGDSALVNIILPETITTIKLEAFASCVNLNLSKLPDSLTTLESAAFGHCKNISISEIPKGVDSIIRYCFQYCENITEITLHENIKYIGTWAFYECKKLEKTTCLADGFIPEINQGSFTRQHPQKKLYVKKGMRAAFVGPNGYCAQIGESCWTYYAFGAFTADNIFELPSGIEIIVSANDENLGNIEIKSDADINNLQVDDKLELTAIPNSARCCRFICWKDETTGDIISRYKTITYTVESATKLVAIFE